MDKPITENLPKQVQDAVAGFLAAADQAPRPGLSMKLPDLDVTLASNGASNNVPTTKSNTIQI